MNKIICKIKELKGVLVTKGTYFFVIAFLLSCSSKIEPNDDYKILDKIVSGIDDTKHQLVFETSKSNEYVISKIQELKKYHLFDNNVKNDSLRQIWGIQDNKVLNPNEFDFLISQKTDSEWDSNKLHLLEQRINKTRDSKLKKTVFVSKPIYTKNKQFSLTYFKEDWSGIIVLKNVDGEWLDYNIIAPMLIRSKVDVIE